MPTATDEELIEAAKHWVEGCGADALKLRYLEDVEPRVYVAIAVYDNDTNVTGSGMSEAAALVELCEKLTTHEICLQCEKSMIFEALPEMILLYDPERFCVATFDDDTRRFIRSCDCNH